MEREHLAVIIEEALEVRVWTTTFIADLDVVFEFGQVGRVLFHVDHGPGLCKWIFRVAFGSVEVDSDVRVEVTGELVTVDDAEDAAIDIQVHSKVEVLLVVDSVLAGEGHLMAL